MGLVIPSHVHACLANDQIVFLDERSDTYSGLASDYLPAFKRLLDGTATEDEVRKIGAQLIPAGLLIDKATGNETLLLQSIDQPTLGKAEEPTQFQITPALLGCLVDRWHWGLRAFCERPLRYFADLRRPKASLRSRLTEAPPLDVAVEFAKPMLDTRWLVPTHDKCLPWSMAMTARLLRLGVPVDLVIGVKMKPFGAHAWVQYQGAVLSDAFDNVAPFTPILVI